jgi:hypothetical protein
MAKIITRKINRRSREVMWIEFWFASRTADEKYGAGGVYKWFTVTAAHLSSNITPPGQLAYNFIVCTGMHHFSSLLFLSERYTIYSLKILKGQFLVFLQYFLQHGFFCRPSYSTKSEDARIKPRTVATLIWAGWCSNHWARSHIQHGLISSTLG